ncbi:30S ribosomal protein S15 [Candidatus Parcubacteria bacterium]|nr:MAG: 30S ribosomal protein S15 [Candidatus Parcubacteria bacterium]
MLKVKEKRKLIDKFQTHDKDTGSAEVQVALLTETIERLADHLKKNAKDNHSRRGLLRMVAKRRKLLDYIAKKNKKSYDSIVKKLGLKK